MDTTNSPVPLPSSHHVSRLLIALGTFVLVLALPLTTTGTVAARSLPVKHTNRSVSRTLPNVVSVYRLPIVVISPVHACVASSPKTAVFHAVMSATQIRHLPYQAALHAQASASALLAAWQHGAFHRSATRPQSLARAMRALKPSPAPVRTIHARLVPAQTSGSQRQVVSPAPPPPAAASASSSPTASTTEPIYGDTVHDAIYKAAQHWGVSYWYLVRLATCESGLNPGAYNPSGASGLFQFMPSTYAAYAARIGEGGSLWNAYSNANVAAYMISQGQAYQWTCSRLI